MVSINHPFILVNGNSAYLSLILICSFFVYREQEPVESNRMQDEDTVEKA